ncbi:M56 family metallopeptidase [Flavihumibacter petaseus]|uniref:Peptidase M56 family protein n=1 Tax=Flavihumibacter petaseus NBRC 106054 TaxID=1220578 RepID=A0A0E9MW30_9BACT|nr:M56 family metallopeptidase [Flavihumibacter petaseus]GAO41927.1 peptidase M56 family protein [Flavihumibacter petaseus NBRC 106054]
MTSYLLSVALIITGCLAFYKLLLQKETFFRINRLVLMACLLIAFTLPLVPVPQQLSFRRAETTTSTAPLRQQLPVPIATETNQKDKEVVTLPATQKADEPVISPVQVLKWLMIIYWFGVAAFGLNFLIQIIALVFRAYRNPAIIDGKFRIVEVTGDKPPCSFGYNIFINPAQYDWDTYNQILQHEKVHARQKHTVDLIAAELVLVFQWFNPFAWIYRKEIESNLEYLTDNVLICDEAVEPSGYQISLLKVSTPQLPLNITCNYNQSLLKKRIAMMNAKQSNFHTTWKYLFLLPVFVIFASLLNKPVAHTLQQGNTNNITQKATAPAATREPATEGYWFATIKGDNVNIQFREEEDEHNSYNGSTFKLSELSTLPKGTTGTFTLKREAGTMEFTGKFEGNQGMGKYKFVADKSYGADMNKDLSETLSERDLMVFYFIDIKRSYVKMLKQEGYKDLSKDNIIPLAALKIDADYIRSIKESGLKGLDLQEMIPFKSLGIDKKYIQEIRNAGYKDITPDQLIAFKSQGIDGSYITKLDKAKGNNGSTSGSRDPDDLVAYKSLQIDDSYVAELGKAGLTDIPHSDLIALKSVGVTPEFVKSVTALGYKNIKSSELIPLKSLNITPEYIKGFQALGYKQIDLDDLIPMKSLGITPEYVKSFQALGYKDIDPSDLIPVKSQNITPEFIKGFEDAGFKDIRLQEFVSLKAVGVTPEYIRQMKEKGFNYSDVTKYITLKSLD